MQYRKFGNTGAEISALGFGCMRLPQKQAGENMVFDYEEGERILRRAFELGVNYFDTAPYYCDKQSEIILGRALKGIRDRVYVSTKNPIEDDSGAHFRERLEKSLAQLDMDHIDFYHMWGIGWDAYVKNIDVKDGPLAAARKAKEEGLIRHISFSFHDAPESMIKLIDTGVFETVLCQYNLMDRANEQAIQYAGERGLGMVIMGPVGGGRLGAPSETIQGLLPTRASSSPEVALRFVLSNPGVCCALSGMSSMEMVEQNAHIASTAGPLSAEESALVKLSMDENKKRAQLYCTGCNYCMPCPFEINIPRNFEVMNLHRVYGLTEVARRQYAEIGKSPWVKGKRAAECTECGVCETKCPQKLKIREQLRETAATLG